MTDDRAWEIFERPRTTARPWGDAPCATLTKGGQLNVSPAVVAHCDGVEYVDLAYARDRQIIMVRPSHETHDSSYKFCRPYPNLAFIRLTLFCRYFGIDHSKARRYPVELHTPGAFLVVLTVIK